MNASDVSKLLFWLLLIVISVIGLVLFADNQGVSTLTELYQVVSDNQKLDRAATALINLFVVIVIMVVTMTILKNKDAKAVQRNKR